MGEWLTIKSAMSRLDPYFFAEHKKYSVKRAIRTVLRLDPYFFLFGRKGTLLLCADTLFSRVAAKP